MTLERTVARVLWLTIFVAVLVWSGIGPKDRATWVLEVFPAVAGLVVILVTWRKYPLTPMVYTLVLVHAVVLMVGGHYTYAEVPLFDTLGEWFGWQRNNYDKLGHFMQGFAPAMIARELLLRLDVVRDRRWLAFLVVCFCLALSAFYELLEWWVALLSEEAADAFLGTQGYVWDTQSDMWWALLGAVSALLLLGRMHDRQLAAFSWPRQATTSRGRGPASAS
jgi:putative membrane protein